MRYAVFFTFDSKAQTAIQSLREKLANEIAGVPRVTGKMGPHLTLALFDNDDFAAVEHKFRVLSSETHSFSLLLNKLGTFKGRKKVLFVEPLPSPTLQESYERCHALFSEIATMAAAYNNPVQWHPHVTLTKGIAGRVFKNAKVCAEIHWKPSQASTHTLGLINVQRPLDVLSKVTLLK